MHGVVVRSISWPIESFVRRNNLDFVITSEVGIYVERDPDTVRAADFALISHRRIAEPLPSRGYVFGLVPDLVVEVISPDYPASAARNRARMWIDAGVRLVITAYIDEQTVIVNRDDGTVQRFSVNDTLTAAPVLPGFTCPVADIFAY